MKSGDKQTLAIVGVGAGIAALYLVLRSDETDLKQKIEEILGSLGSGSGSGLDLSGMFEGITWPDMPQVQFPDINIPAFEMPTVNFDFLKDWLAQVPQAKAPEAVVVNPFDAMSKTLDEWAKSFWAKWDDLTPNKPESETPIPNPDVVPGSETDSNWWNTYTQFLKTSTLRSIGIGVSDQYPIAGIPFAQPLQDVGNALFTKRFGYSPFADQSLSDMAGSKLQEFLSPSSGQSIWSGLLGLVTSIFRPSPVGAYTGGSVMSSQFAGAQAYGAIASEAKAAYAAAAAARGKAVLSTKSGSSSSGGGSWAPATPANTGGSPSSEYTSYWNQVPL